MKNFNLLLKSTIIVTVLLVTGCSTIPDALQTPEDTVLTNFAQVRENTDSAQGNLARWGGVIAKVVNNADSTMLEIVHFPLKSSTRPKQDNHTQGRFRVYVSGLLDPVIYKEGRSITALGNIVSAEQGKIGEFEYTYPVLKASYVHLWKDIQKVDVSVTQDPFWHTPSYWYYPRSYIYPRSVVVRKSSTPVKKK